MRLYSLFDELLLLLSGYISYIKSPCGTGRRPFAGWRNPDGRNCSCRRISLLFLKKRQECPSEGFPEKADKAGDKNQCRPHGDLGWVHVLEHDRIITEKTRACNA